MLVANLRPLGVTLSVKACGVALALKVISLARNRLISRVKGSLVHEAVPDNSVLSVGCVSVAAADLRNLRVCFLQRRH